MKRASQSNSILKYDTFHVHHVFHKKHVSKTSLPLRALVGSKLLWWVPGPH